MRTFIAIDISEDIGRSLSLAICHLKYAGADVKWVDPANIHLTLKFLGEISGDKLAQVKSALDGIADSTKRFRVNIKDIGAFPGTGRPRVIWAGLSDGARESKDLACSIDEAMSGLGFAKETRPFEPHLTMGRVRSGRNIDKLKSQITSSKLQIPQEGCPVDSIILYQSTLTPNGSIYTRLHEPKLRQE